MDGLDCASKEARRWSPRREQYEWRLVGAWIGPCALAHARRRLGAYAISPAGRMAESGPPPATTCPGTNESGGRSERRSPDREIDILAEGIARQCWRGKLYGHRPAGHAQMFRGRRSRGGHFILFTCRGDQRRASS